MRRQMVTALARHSVRTAAGSLPSIRVPRISTPASAWVSTFTIVEQQVETSALYAQPAGGAYPLTNVASISNNGQQICFVGVETAGKIRSPLNRPANTGQNAPERRDQRRRRRIHTSSTARSMPTGRSSRSPAPASNLVPSDTNGTQTCSCSTTLCGEWRRQDRADVWRRNQRRRLRLADGHADGATEQERRRHRDLDGGVGSPWLQVTPASGSESGTLSISVTPAAGLPPSGTVSGTSS